MCVQASSDHGLLNVNLQHQERAWETDGQQWRFMFIFGKYEIG